MGWWFDWGGLLLTALVEGAARFVGVAVAEAGAPDFAGKVSIAMGRFSRRSTASRTFSR
jgi:hypothetical protein